MDIAERSAFGRFLIPAGEMLDLYPNAVILMKKKGYEMHELYTAMEREYRRLEHLYQIAKHERIDSAVLSLLAAMNTIQRILENAGLSRLEEIDNA